jgi:hypothetical protein
MDLKKKKEVNGLLQLQLFNRYVKSMIKQKNDNSHSPQGNGKKYIVILACHCNSDIKLEVLKKNLKYFDFENIQKIVINTIGLEFGNMVSEICSKHNNTKYYEISNSYYYDFGKWIYGLKNIAKNHIYDYVILTNDSFIIHNSINHFFNLIAKHNVELYGYNDSSQTKYHYQSYLFSLRKDAVPLFIVKVNDTSLKIKNQNDVINNFETEMTNWFSSKKTFLNLGNFELNKFQNIFFTNDKLYLPLKKFGLLPFTKIKRLHLIILNNFFE